MLDKPIAIVDIETTGGTPQQHRITEIGIIKIDNGKIIDEYKTLVNPNQTIPEYITRLTGIDNSMTKDAPIFDAIASEIEDFLKDSYFMAHHVMFDFSFIDHQMKILGRKIKPPLLCSVKLSRSLEKGLSRHSLENIIRYNNIAVDARHRTYDDAKAVKDYLDILIERHGIEKVTQSLKKQLIINNQLELT